MTDTLDNSPGSQEAKLMMGVKIVDEIRPGAQPPAPEIEANGAQNVQDFADWLVSRGRPLDAIHFLQAHADQPAAFRSYSWGPGDTPDPSITDGMNRRDIHRHAVINWENRYGGPGRPIPEWTANRDLPIPWEFVADLFDDDQDGESLEHYLAQVDRKNHATVS